MINLSKKSTLIVEDFAEFARSVRAMMRALGATDIDIVNNAEDAIDSCKSKKYDIILADYNLGPKKDGQQLLEELIKNRLTKVNCIFLMLTAENSTAMVMGAVEYRPDSYIAKPFSDELLKSRLRKAMDKKEVLAPVSEAMAGKNWQEALEQIKIVMSEHPKYKMSCLKFKYKSLKELSRFDDALKLVTNIVAQRAIPWALEAIGEQYFLKRELDKAQDIFINMVKEFPMSLEGYDWLAKIQHKLGEPIKAQETLVKALQKSPKALNRQKMLGCLAEENNDIERMTIAYRNAVKYSENSSFASPDEYLKFTQAVTKQLSSDNDIDRKTLAQEAETTFAKLKENLASTESTQLRSNIAQASFYTSNKQGDKAGSFLIKAEKNIQELGEQLSPSVSIEICSALSKLNKTDLAHQVINEAIQQNLENADFMAQAAKLTNNSELVESCKRANQYNNKAVEYFRKKQYQDSASYFDKAHQLSPGNINIRLNYVQTLLKQMQSNGATAEIIATAEELLEGAKDLSFNDRRYPRYSELCRLVQIILSKFNEN